jgi:hypothetical protein
MRSALNRKFGYLHLQFRTISASELVGSIGTIVQIGLTFIPLESGGLEQLAVRSEPLCAVVSEHTSLVGKPAVALLDLKAHPLIVACSERTHPIFYERLVEHCRALGFRPKIAEEVTSAQEAVRPGGGKCRSCHSPAWRLRGSTSLDSVLSNCWDGSAATGFSLRREDFFASEVLEELADLSDEKNLKCAS